VHKHFLSCSTAFFFLRVSRLCLGEISTLTATLRPLSLGQESTRFLANLTQLRFSLPLHDPIDRAAALAPIIHAIRSPESTSPFVISACLTSLSRFISLQFLHPSAPRAVDAANEIAEALPKCRFETVDASDDEVLLAKLASVALALIQADVGVWLSVLRFFLVF
jgi:hypothetical protein